MRPPRSLSTAGSRGNSTAPLERPGAARSLARPRRRGNMPEPPRIEPRPAGRRNRGRKHGRAHPTRIVRGMARGRRCRRIGASPGPAAAHGRQPDPAGVESDRRQHHEGARLRPDTRLRTRGQDVAVDLGLLRRARDRRSRDTDRRADRAAEAAARRRAGQNHRDGPEALGPRHLRQGARHPEPGGSARQAARGRHGLAAISDRVDLCPVEGPDARHRHHGRQCEFRAGAQPARGRPGGRRHGHRTDRDHDAAGEPAIAHHLQRRRSLEGADRA